MHRQQIKPGEYGYGRMPYSEACIHLRVAGKAMSFRLTTGSYPSVQLYDDGREYSFPITRGEAGVFDDGQGGFYYYKVEEGIESCVTESQQTVGD